MILQIGNVLPRETAEELRAALAEEAFAAGASTAGWHARPVKNNEQSKGPAAQRAIAAVREALLAHPVFKAAARPKLLTGLLVSRYQQGMAYGTHMDDALMGGIRTDLSFTVFLADEDSYGGGELVIDGNDGEERIKLPMGSAVLYPTTSLHRVTEVTGGERLAVVGWVRSLVRRADEREILFDLDQTLSQLRDAKAERAVLDRVMKVRANLMRLWVED